MEVQRGHNTCKNEFRVISLVCTYFPLKINIYFEFQVYMLSNVRNMTKCQFLHDNDDDDNNDAKEVVISQAFSENSRTKKSKCCECWCGICQVSQCQDLII